MTDNLDGRTMRILSLSDGNSPVGVNLTKPASQIVHTDARVQDWTFRRVGEHTYRLCIGGYNHVGVTGREGGMQRVIASIHPEHGADWIIRKRENQGAYTIELANRPSCGWTVGEGNKRDVMIRPVVMAPSEPPQFLTSQLFAMEEEE